MTVDHRRVAHEWLLFRVGWACISHYSVSAAHTQSCKATVPAHPNLPAKILWHKNFIEQMKQSIVSRFPGELHQLVQIPFYQDPEHSWYLDEESLPNETYTRAAWLRSSVQHNLYFLLGVFGGNSVQISFPVINVTNREELQQTLPTLNSLIEPLPLGRRLRSLCTRAPHHKNSYFPSTLLVLTLGQVHFILLSMHRPLFALKHIHHCFLFICPGWDGFLSFYIYWDLKFALCNKQIQILKGWYKEPIMGSIMHLLIP